MLQVEGDVLRRQLLITIAALMAGIGSARGGIQVLDDIGAPVPSSAWSLASTPSGYRIVLQELHDPWQVTWFVVRCDAGERFDEVEIAVDGPVAGSPVQVRIEGAGAIDSIVQTGSAETHLEYVQVLQDIGQVQAQSIGTLIAGRDVLGPIVATTPSNPVRGIVAIEAGRDIAGPLLAEHGRIEYVSAGRSLGASGAPMRIRAAYGIGTLECDSIAALDVDLRSSTGHGTLSRLHAPAVEGIVMVDSIDPSATPALDVLSFDGILCIEGALSGQDPVIRIGEQGLAGQVIVNAADSGGSWTAPIELGTPSGNGYVQLQGPAYASTPAELGGGAVGVVPFRMHMSGCAPLSGSVVEIDGSSSLVAALRWYGPVAWPEGAPLDIDRRASDGATGWEPVPAVHFLYLHDPVDSTQLLVESAAAGLGFVPGWEYRLRPNGNLLCAVSSVPPVAGDDAWTIEIEQAEVCPGDVNGDAGVGVTDLLVLLACWGEVSGDLDGRSDLDGDGVVDVIDLLGLLGAWGPCPS